MVLSKKKLITFLLFLLISVPPILVGIFLYRPLLSVFPQFPELEIQAYYLTFGGVFMLYCFFFWLSLNKRLSVFRSLFQGDIHVSRGILLLIIIIEALGIFYFYKYSYPILSKTTDFRDIGISLDDSFAWGIFLGIILMCFAMFVLIIKVAKPRLKFLFYLISVCVIILLSFKITGLNSYDYAYFAGPVNDILHRKYLLYNSFSQYGFLLIIFLSQVFRFIPLGLMNLTIFNVAIVTSGFILVFLLMQYLYKNKLLALFSIIFIIFANYIIQIEPQISYPQTSFLRFGFWTLLAVSLVLKAFYKDVRCAKLVSLIPYLILTISFFWVFDNGFYILSAYIFYSIFNQLGKSFTKIVKNVLIELTKVFLSLSLGFLVIEILYNFILRISPNWNYYLADPSFYLSGFGLLPLPNSFWHWIIMGGYLLMLTYLLLIKRFSKDQKLSERLSVISFILFYGIFQFAYYMGRSHLNNLHHVIIPFFVCLFYFLDLFLDKIRRTTKVSYYLLGSLTCSLILALPLYFIFIQGSKNLVNYNFFKTLNVLDHRIQIENELFSAMILPTTIPLLENKYGDYISKNGITLVSLNDAWYLIRLNKTNNILSNNLGYFLEETQINKLAGSIIKNNYKFVFIDQSISEEKSVEDYNQADKIYGQIKKYYLQKEQIGSLSVLERI